MSALRQLNDSVSAQTDFVADTGFSFVACTSQHLLYKLVNSRLCRPWRNEFTLVIKGADKRFCSLPLALINSCCDYTVLPMVVLGSVAETDFLWPSRLFIDKRQGVGVCCLLHQHLLYQFVVSRLRLGETGSLWLSKVLTTLGISRVPVCYLHQYLLPPILVFRRSSLCCQN